MSKSNANLGGQAGGCFGVVFMLIFGLLWSGPTLVGDGVVVWGVFQQLRAIGHSTTQGRIIQSQAERDAHDDDPSYHVKLKYSYRVDDRRYEGSRYRYGARLSSLRAVQRIVAEYPVDKQVTVYYRPSDPQDAILRPGIGGDDLFVAMAMMPFNLVMLGIWIGVGSGFYARAAKPLARGAKVLDDGICIRVRLTSLPPLTAAAIAVGAVSFLGVFIVAIGYGADPAMPVMLVAWAVALAAGICAYQYRQRKLEQGDCDLVIDRVSEIITLPRTLGRKADVKVPMRQFTSVEVERVEKTDSEGGRFCRYVPVLTFKNETGTTRREKIVEWSSRAHAEGLADWLREQLHIKPPKDPLQ